jgi:hypothetical protein
MRWILLTLVALGCGCREKSTYPCGGEFGFFQQRTYSTITYTYCLDEVRRCRSDCRALCKTREDFSRCRDECFRCAWDCGLPKGRG